MSTGKNEICNNIAGSRLEALREALVMNWGELANHLSISRSMLDFMRKGIRNPSAQMLRQLADAERAAGIGPPEVASRAPPRETMTVREPGSNDWKNDAQNFQRLEKRMADIEQKLDALLEWIQKENK